MTDTKKRIIGLLARMKAMNEADVDHEEQEVLPPESDRSQITTLKPGVIRPLSPMLAARFDFAGAWINANLDQNWLSLSEIANVPSNPEIKELIDLRLENWDHVPPATVDAQDCAIFAYNPYEPEETYLVWQDGKDEPVVWRYFGADYKMFNNLEHYLEYIVGDRGVDDSGRVTDAP